MTAAVLGLAIGAALGMLGGGGSLLVLPVLVFVLGETPHQAATASLVIVTLGALAGGLTQARAGAVCWRHAALLTAAALPAVVAGTALGAEADGRLLLGAFGALMVVAAYPTALRARSSSTPGTRCPALCPGHVLLAGGAAGLLTGFLGVGGGFVVVPLLAFALGFGMRSAIGTSLVMITATGVFGALTHLASGRELDPGLTAVMSAAVVAGALTGALAGQRGSVRTLTLGFSALVTVGGVVLIVGSAFLSGAGSG